MMQKLKFKHFSFPHYQQASAVSHSSIEIKKMNCATQEKPDSSTMAGFQTT
jgi:hypothetical protein